MSNESKAHRFYREQSILNVTPPNYHPLNLVLVLLFTALFVGWLLGLGSTANNQQEAYPIPPISMLTMMGTISGRMPIEVTCNEHTITARTVTESEQQTSPQLPVWLTLTSLEPLVEAYYSLAAPATQLTLELRDANGNVTRNFEAISGTVDIRQHGIYIAAELRDESSALIYLSAQGSCQTDL